jgi:hypothetical protein
MEARMVRFIAAGTLLAAAFAGPSALAQGTPQHAFCLKSATNTECAYDSMTQCEAAKQNDSDTCVPNSSPMSR